MSNTNFETNRSNRHSENKSIEVTSPYNFVPLSDVVYFPSWSKQISQDAPFKKSYSGCIEFKIKAKSPIFVRNGHTQEQMEEAKEICKSISQQINNEISKKLNFPSHISKKEKEKKLLTYLDANKTEWQEKFMKLLERKAADGADLSYLKFSNINENFFIPSTSIKGCIRNALEILSYGKIRIDGKIGGIKYTYNNPPEISEDSYSNHSSNEKDLAECIFGIGGDSSTRGRVQFSHAFASDHIIFSWKLIERLILNSPKASYYPFYIKQNPDSNGNLKKYTTYLNNNYLINGWKKYPVRNGTTSKMMNNPKLDTFLTPLDTGSEFNCKMRFFNLKGVELGALLSVLTFHDSKEDYYHSIGQGKPYGFGKIKIDIENLSINGKFSDKNNISDSMLIFLKTFENNISQTTNRAWHLSRNVKDFYTMSYDILAASDSLFQYLELDDFSKIKEEYKYLKRFRDICGQEKFPKPFLKFSK